MGRGSCHKYIGWVSGPFAGLPIAILCATTGQRYFMDLDNPFTKREPQKLAGPTGSGL